VNAADLRARIEAGLTFRHQVDGHTFVLVLPTRQRHDQIVRESMGNSFATTPATHGRFRVALVAECLRGWEGPRVRDLWPEHEVGNAPLPYGADTAQLLIDERTDWHDALYAEITRRVELRAEALRADAGNSRSGSPGSGGEPTTTTTAEPN
jgi:hypothetical protein